MINLKDNTQRIDDELVQLLNNMDNFDAQKEKRFSEILEKNNGSIKVNPDGTVTLDPGFVLSLGKGPINTTMSKEQFMYFYSDYKQKIISQVGDGTVIRDSSFDLSVNSWLTKEYQKVKYLSNEWSIDPVGWSTYDVLKWKLKGKSDFLFKKKYDFVKNYKNVIKLAADEYDIPEFLLAGICYNEFAGDPYWVDDIGYNIRKFDWSGPEWVDENLTITKSPKLTSFGSVSIQVRRAEEALGYNPEKISAVQEENIIKMLKDPVQNIFIVAKHVHDLKQIDYANIDTCDLSEDNIKIIAARYNRGPEISLEEVKKDLSYGNAMYKHENSILEALE